MSDLRERTELRGCPFCDSSDIALSEDSGVVYCKKCGAFGPLAGTADGMCAAWNRRASAPDVPREPDGWVAEWETLDLKRWHNDGYLYETKDAAEAATRKLASVVCRKRVRAVFGATPLSAESREPDERFDPFRWPGLSHFQESRIREWLTTAGPLDSLELRARGVDLARSLVCSIPSEWWRQLLSADTAPAPQPMTDSRGGVEGNPAIIQPVPDELDDELRAWLEQGRHALALLEEWLDRDVPDDSEEA